MKNFVMMFVGLMLSLTANGQTRVTTSLELRLSDQSLLKVAINDRNFDKVAPVLTIGNIPGRKPHIRVYRFRPYADGRGGKAELVYSGTIKLKKDLAYEGVVDVGRRKLLLREKSTAMGSQQARAEETSPSISKVVPGEGLSGMSEGFRALRQAMDAADADSEKLGLAEDYLSTHKMTSEELGHVVAWFLFDDTRMSFVKTAYPQLIDKENLQSTDIKFTTDSNKKEFEAFLKSQ